MVFTCCSQKEVTGTFPSGVGLSGSFCFFALYLLFRCSYELTSMSMANIDIATPLKRVKISISEELTLETEILFLAILRRSQKPSSTKTASRLFKLRPFLPGRTSAPSAIPGSSHRVCLASARRSPTAAIVP